MKVRTKLKYATLLWLGTVITGNYDRSTNSSFTGKHENIYRLLCGTLLSGTHNIFLTYIFRK